MYITNKIKTFDDECLKDAIGHSIYEYPNESCGLIVDDEYIPCDNIADDKENGFEIRKDIFDKYYIEGRVQAVIHSHTDERYVLASEADQQQQVELDVPFGLINLKGKGVSHFVFWGDSLPIEPLEGRPFIFGVWDCFSLMRDYVKIKFEINTEMPIRKFAFWYNNINLFEQYIEEKILPLEYIDIKEATVGDFLLYNVHGTKFINHVGLMERKGLMLHHYYDQISTRYPISHNQEWISKACRLIKE